MLVSWMVLLCPRPVYVCLSVCVRVPGAQKYVLGYSYYRTLIGNPMHTTHAVNPRVSVAVRPPKVAEATTTPLPKHSLDGCTVDMRHRTSVGGGYRLAARRRASGQLQYGPSDGELCVCLSVSGVLELICKSQDGRLYRTGRVRVCALIQRQQQQQQQPWSCHCRRSTTMKADERATHQCHR